MAISGAASLAMLMGTAAFAQVPPSDGKPVLIKTNYYGREPVTPSPQSVPAPPPAAPPIPEGQAPLPVLPPLAFTPGQEPLLLPPAPPSSQRTPAGPMPAIANTIMPNPESPPVGAGVQNSLPPWGAQAGMAQLPKGIGALKDEKAAGSVKIQFDPPGPERLFKLQSYASWKEQMRQESRITVENVTFPTDPILAKSPYTGRDWAKYGMHSVAEPNYLCYGRTYFDQLNFERYGWDLGPVTPAVCAGRFFLDVAMLPYHMGTDPTRHYECNSGYCLPGDPVPLLLYPPHLSVTGLAAEAAVVTGGFFVFP